MSTHAISGPFGLTHPTPFISTSRACTNHVHASTWKLCLFVKNQMKINSSRAPTIWIVVEKGKWLNFEYTHSTWNSRSVRNTLKYSIGPSFIASKLKKRCMGRYRTYITSFQNWKLYAFWHIWLGYCSSLSVYSGCSFFSILLKMLALGTALFEATLHCQR